MGIQILKAYVNIEKNNWPVLSLKKSLILHFLKPIVPMYINYHRKYRENSTELSYCIQLNTIAQWVKTKTESIMLSFSKIKNTWIIIELYVYKANHSGHRSGHTKKRNPSAADTTQSSSSHNTMATHVQPTPSLDIKTTRTYLRYAVTLL